MELTILIPLSSLLLPLFHYTPMQLVVPRVVRIAVMMLAITCRAIFHPSLFFMVFSILN